MPNANPTMVLFVIVALVAVGPFTIDVYLPAMPALKQVFGVSTDAVQLTLSLYILGFALAQLVVGPLSDRFGRRPILFAGLSLYIVASIGCGLSSSIEMLSVCRVLQAAGGCAGPVLGRTMVRDIYGPIRSARVMSYVGSAMSLAPAIAPLIGGLILVQFGWGAIFGFLTIYGIACLAGYAASIPETLPQEDRQPLALSNVLRNYAQIVRNRQWLGYTLCCAGIFSGLFAFLSGSSFVFIDYLEFSEKQFGLLFGFIVVGHFFGTVIGGRLSAKVQVQPLVKMGVWVALLGGLTIAGLALTGVHNVVSVIAPMMVFTVGMGIAVPQALAGAIAPFGDKAGSASGLLGFVQMTLGSLVGVTVGYWHDGSPVSMACGIGAAGILAFAGYLSLPREVVPARA